MTGAWSRSPVGRVLRLTEVGALGEKLGENNGESRRVCRVQKYPDWIYKEYPAPVSIDHVQRLTQLIQLPEQMTAAHKALVDEHTSWPVTRVVNAQQQTIGVLMPLAPATFSAPRQLPSGRTKLGPLEVDVLALTEARQAQMMLPSQSLADRISVCASMAAVGALFERYGLVYLDWSYANVFWSLNHHSAYVIDLDGCSFGPRLQIQSPNWADPLVPRGRQAGNESDRYRAALLIARCLTGMRADLAETRSGLFGLLLRGGPAGGVAGLLIKALGAQSTAERPSIAELSAALEAAKSQASRPGTPISSPGTGGVKQWKPLPTRGTVTPKPRVTVPLPPSGQNRPAPWPIVKPQAPTRPTSTPSRVGGSSNYQPVGARNIPPPSRPSSGGGGAAALVFIAILVIVLLIIFL
jgi:hypothetical protein